MKLFDVPWRAVLRDLERWAPLPLEVRRTLLDHLKPSGNVAAAALGPHRDALLASGLARLDAAGRRALVREEARDVVRVLRAMDRHRVFDAPTPVELARYLDEHFTADEVLRLGGWTSARFGYVGRHQLVPRVASEAWAGDLLAAERDAALRAWAAERGVPTSGDVAPLRALQALARTLLDTPDGVPLGELVARAPDERARDGLADALHAGLQLAVVFAGLRAADLEPRVGLWPPAARDLRRPAPQLPAAAAPVETFELAVRPEDMTTLLTAAAAEPVRLRATDLAVFARARRAIEERLVTVPDWAEGLLPLDAETRLHEAAAELQARGLARVTASGREPRLEATPAGLRWLAAAPDRRLAALVDPMRAARERNPPGAYDATVSRFFPFRLPYLRLPKTLDVRDALTRAFLAADAPLPLEAFLDYHVRAANPLLVVDRPQLAALVGGDTDAREFLRQTWQQMLRHFLALRLIAFGGVRLGRTEDGTVTIALTDVGRYLLGAAPSFAYGVPEAVDVIVQPNFDVVFLGPAPAAEAAVGRFAERAGRAPGVAFRITRASVLGAAEAGRTRDEVLRTLRELSSRPLPSNVEREIEGWFGLVRRAHVRPATLLECPDEETATRVLAVLGAKVRRLAPTVFELPEGSASAQAAQLRRLRAAGVFLGTGTGEQGTGNRDGG